MVDTNDVCKSQRYTLGYNDNDASCEVNSDQFIVVFYCLLVCLINAYNLV